MMVEKTEKAYIYALQIVFACSISFGSQSIQFENMHNWLIMVARYVSYIIIIKGTYEFTVLGYGVFNKTAKIELNKINQQCKLYFYIFAVSISILIYSNEKILGEDFLLIFMAHLVTKYPEIDKKKLTINYGEGMACSYFEGYLAHVIPSDGATFVGFEENINKFEASQRTIFPVKRLFIIYTKSLYCPPDLKNFNKSNRDLPYLEAMQSLEEIVKNVAGVQNRTYKNAAYKIYRLNKTPVPLAAECATPLHTLHRVLQKKALYDELADVDPQELVEDFCSMLRRTIQKSPDCRDKCELVYYDDTDPTQNLADILLDKIRELEPDFENIINRDI